MRAVVESSSMTKNLVSDVVWVCCGEKALTSHVDSGRNVFWVAVAQECDALSRVNIGSRRWAGLEITIGVEKR